MATAARGSYFDLPRGQRRSECVDGLSRERSPAWPSPIEPARDANRDKEQRGGNEDFERP